MILAPNTAVGIDDVALHVPKLFISTLGEFAEARGIEPAKLARGIGVEKMAVAGVAQLLIDSLAHAQIGVENAHWPYKLEQHLTILIEWAAEDGPAKLLPFSSPAAKLEEVPHMFAPSVPAPVALLPGLDMFLDRKSVV